MEEGTALAIISNGFWLVLILVVFLLFGRELKTILLSLGAFKVMGASFQLRNKRATLESYAILANILVEILSERGTAEEFYTFVSHDSARQLASFARRYIDEVAAEDRNVELVKNVALLAGRKGNYQSAIAICNELLKHEPEDMDILYVKARMLRESGIEENLTAAEGIYDKLMKRHSGHGEYWFSLARAEARLGKFSKSLHSLREAIDLGYEERSGDMLDSLELLPLREAKPDEFLALRQIRADRRSAGKT
jgi:tetratricopeptide (TPR) repeat protein